MTTGQAIEAAYREHSRRVLATLVRLLGDLDLAEEALHEAFAAAARQWPGGGVPDNPRAWLVSTGRFRAIDRLRRRARFDAMSGQLAEHLAGQMADDAQAAEAVEGASVADDRLRLIFTCCHPALAPDAQVALTLREMCGLTTEEIARAFLVPAPTLAQRIVRAKGKIREAKIPYETPSAEDLPGRLEVVLAVVYLVFNEGYSASAGEDVIRADLSGEAIRLGRLLADLLLDSDTLGLLALMLLHEARRAGRTTADGDLVLLADQDRGLWDRGMIAEGAHLARQALMRRPVGSFALQAAIAALHAEAPSAEVTDWREIVGLYDVLLQADPSAVVALNRAAAVAMRDGPQAGLELIDAILERGELADYGPAHAARADLLRRLHRTDDAREAYVRALALAQQGPERRFLAGRLAALSSGG